MYTNPLDPNDRPRPTTLPPRLWPWVVLGLLFALLAWAYFEPIPNHTTMDPPSLGPDSPLYGPLNGKERP